MTDAEISLLRSLAEADVVTFMPEDNTAAALARFKATVESLTEMQKAGWIELEVTQAEKRNRGHPHLLRRPRRGARGRAGRRCGCWATPVGGRGAFRITLRASWAGR
jgi:hypothetical protein